MLRRLYTTKAWTYTQASQWCKDFTKESIPRDSLTVNVSRSSGPGGQNVNKVNTKVDMRLNLNNAQWIPDYAKQKLLQQPNVRKSKDGEIIIVSDRTRSQASNLEDCMHKLTEVIRSAVRVPRDPDAETLQRVKRLEEKSEQNRKNRKQQNSFKKTQRRSKGPDY